MVPQVAFATTGSAVGLVAGSPAPAAAAPTGAAIPPGGAAPSGTGAPVGAPSQTGVTPFTGAASQTRHSGLVVLVVLGAMGLSLLM